MARRHKGLSFYRKKKKLSTSTMKEIFNWLLGIAVAIFIAFVLILSVGMKTSVIGVSMEPNLYNGQKILINRLIYKVSSPKKGDVVVFLPNGNHNLHFYVKRVVAVPGETVQIIDGYLYIDGVLQSESDAYDKMADAGIAENDMILGKDEYFVLGDNRNNSEDSRSANIGVVNKSTIEGKAWYHMAAESSGMGFVE